MDGISDNPPKDLKIAAMPISEAEKLARAARIKALELHAMYGNLMYQIGHQNLPKELMETHYQIHAKFTELIATIERLF